MSSVTQRISEIKQPTGGYLPLSKMNIEVISDGYELKPNENIHSSVIGMAVVLWSSFFVTFVAK